MSFSELRFDQLANCITAKVKPQETDINVYYGLEHLDSDSLKIRSCGSPSEVIGEKIHALPGDIIFGKRRAYQRKLGVADCECIASAHSMVLRAKNDTILPEFLPYFMQSDLFMERAIMISEGSLSPTIKWKTLAKEKFLIPDKATQCKITEVMRAFDESIETKKDLLECLLELKSTLIINSSSIGSNLKFNDVFELRRELVENNDEKTHYVALEHMESSTGRLIGVGTAADAISIKTKFYPGDILFGKLRPYLRKYWLANIEGVCSTEILVLKCKENCLSVYGYFLVQDERFIRHAIHHSFGTKMPRASWEKMRDYDIRLPSVNEQEILVRKLIAVENNIYSALESIDATTELKKETLTKLIL